MLKIKILNFKNIYYLSKFYFTSFNINEVKTFQKYLKIKLNKEKIKNFLILGTKDDNDKG